MKSHPSKCNSFRERPIGIYVDSNDDGHRRRAIAIAKQAPGYFTLLGAGLRGKSDALPIVDLPPALCPDSASPAAKRSFSGQNLLQRSRRLSRIAEWIDTADPALLLIDSCADIADLARLKAVPTVYMRLSGKRNDPAHLRAYAAAEAVLCPFHCLLEANATPQWLRARSRYFPGLTLPEQNCPPYAAQAHNFIAPESVNALPPQPILLIVTGCDCRGSRAIDAETARFAAAARALPDWQIRVIGQNHPPRAAGSCPANLHFYSQAEQIDAAIAAADIVAGAADDRLISAIAAAGKPFICVPPPRPYDEHDEKAARLAALRAAAIYRRWPRNWQKTVRETLRRGAVLAALHDENAGRRAAEFLLDTAYGTKQPLFARPQTEHDFITLRPQTGFDSAALNGPIAAYHKPLSRFWQKQGLKTGRPRKAA